MRRLFIGMFMMGLALNAMSMDMNDSKNDSPTESPSVDYDVMQSLGDPSFDFRLLSEVAAAQQDPIICVSPLSASVALSMVAEGALGQTRDEILKTLGFDDIKDLGKYYQQVTGMSGSDSSGISLGIANSLWISDEFSVKRGFKNTLHKYYNALVTTMDFSEASSAGRINSWCEDNTAGKIDKIIEGTIDPSTMMMLVNALYFKGEWSEAFNPQLTYEDKFYGIGGESDTKFMVKRDERYLYGVSGSAEILELPYGKDGNYVMDIVLPAKDVDIADYLESFNADVFNSLESSMSMEKISYLRIPLFKAECNMSLNDILKNMGICQAFSPSADFGAISKEPLMIDEVMQKTFIEVNEVGTEAAAVTAVSFMKASIDHERLDFVANRPFIFIIRERNSNTILFNGVVRAL